MDGVRPFVVGASRRGMRPLRRYSRPVLIGLRAIRVATEHQQKLTTAERHELASALRLTAAYIDLETQIEELPD